MTILDSGARKEFASGAVRDIQEGKGRFDLIPLDLMAEFLGPEPDQILISIEAFQRSGDKQHIRRAISLMMDTYFDDTFDSLYQLAIHFEEGAAKYSDRNWEKGMPAHCYISSGVHHYLQLLRGDTDERHDRACMWNLFCGWWTALNHPDLNDLPIDFGDIPEQEGPFDYILDQIAKTPTAHVCCGDCENATTSHLSPPCNACEKGELFSPILVDDVEPVPVKVELRYCYNCLHYNVPSLEEPCMTCGRESDIRDRGKWESKDKPTEEPIRWANIEKECTNCRHEKLRCDELPCDDCLGSKNWEAKE